MKVVILCGGKGTRMMESTYDNPKPLTLIGDKPILWHIMKIYSYYGYNDFILLLGYKGDKIKEYFMDYDWKNYDFVLDNETKSFKPFGKPEKWKITFLDTGIDTMTGGRIKKAENYIGEEPFMLTYGDGLSDINLNNLLEFHKLNNRVGTLTGIAKKSQYGVLSVVDNIATTFNEKSQIEGLINGGFFVLNKEIFNYLGNDEKCIFEQEPLINLVKDKQLAVFPHTGFWTSIDTAKDAIEANKAWERNETLWRIGN